MDLSITILIEFAKLIKYCRSLNIELREEKNLVVCKF